MTVALSADVEDVGAFVRSRIGAGVVDVDPFPHVCIHNVFPDDYYQRLLANWPDENEFIEMGEGGIFGLFFRPTASRIPRLGERGLVRAGRVKTFAVWDHFRSIVKRDIIPELATKLSDSIVAMMRPGGAEAHPAIKAEDLEIVHDFLIIRRNSHILAPHLDDLRSLIQLLIYFPEDDSRPHLGTQYFKQVGGGRSLSPRELGDARIAQYAEPLGIQVVEAKRIPFTRNTLVANLNNPTSWHGQHLNERYDRKGYQAFVGVRSDLLRLFFDDVSASLLAQHAG